MLNVRIADKQNFDEIYSLYAEVCKFLETSPFSPHWEIDVYPNREDIAGLIERRELVICMDSGKIVGAVFSLSKTDSVIFLNTFSATVAPSIRVGYMVLPLRLLDEFESRLGFYSCTVPVFEQYVLSELIQSGDFERHINRVRRSRRREGR